MEDYYKILEISPTASVEVLTQAYRTLVKKHHPDRYYSSSHKQQMGRHLQLINEAYTILSDPKRREQYDTDYAAYLASKPLLEAQQAQHAKKKKLWYSFLLVLFLFLSFRMATRILFALPPLFKLFLIGAAVYGVYRVSRR